MSATKKISIIIIGLLIVFFAGVMWYQWSERGASSATTTPAPSSSVSGVGAAPQPAASQTIAPVPADTVVVQQNATNAPPGVAVPTVVAPGDPSGDVSYRSFTITADNGVFSPATVTVNQGDTVNLEIAAVDANYAFTQPDYGFNAAIAKGKTQRIQFQALQSGDFTFYCGSCGGPSKGPVGHIIVVAN